MLDLKEKYGNWALITGASSGIGKGFARRLAEEGISLVLVARRKERLEILSHELKSQYNIEIIIVPLDLTEDNIIEKLNGYIESISIDILINNAGTGRPEEFAASDIDYQTNMIKLNCIVPTILTHYFAKKMIGRRKGAIIFLGSSTSFQPVPFMSAYAATKVFNSHFGNALWWELKKYNIDVLTVNPGGTDTEFERLSKFGKGPEPRSVDNVVNTALKALGRKPNVVDGMSNKFTASASKFISRKLLVNISGYISEKIFSGRK